MYDVEDYDEKKKVIRGPIIYRSGLSRLAVVAAAPVLHADYKGER